MQIDAVSNCASLRSQSSLLANDGDTVFLKKNEAGKADFYEWVSASTQADDGRSCIQPSDITGPGRYIRVGSQVHVLVFTGQSNAALSSPVSDAVPAGGYSGDLLPVPGTYDRVSNGTVDVLTYRGPMSISPGIRTYEPATGQTVHAGTSTSVMSGRNNIALGAAVRIHDETCNPVVIVLRAHSGHPIERLTTSNVLPVTGVSLAGGKVTLSIPDLRNIRAETYDVVQRIDLVNVCGLNGRYYSGARSKPYADTRFSKVPVEGTITVQDETGADISSAGLPAYTGGGKVQFHHIWNDLCADLTNVQAQFPDAIISIGVDQSEANGGVSRKDCFTTAGGCTTGFVDKRRELVRQFLTHPYLAKTTRIVFFEAVRDGAYIKDKIRNLDAVETAGIHPLVSVCSSAGCSSVDHTHVDDRFGKGWHLAAPAIMGGGFIPDPMAYRFTRQWDNSIGYRNAFPVALSGEVFTFSNKRDKGRDYWNGGIFKCTSARIILDATQLVNSTAENDGGILKVNVEATNGITPKSDGSPDTAAAGRTVVFATGISFIDNRTGITSTSTYYCGASPAMYVFEHVGPGTIYVTSPR